MKKVIFTLLAIFSIVTSAKAMSYEQARDQALFLTDKMAYELNLTDEQYEAAYEINLDYLMSVTSRHNVFGTYWERRNLDMSYILLDWQWRAFRAATYFFRPLYWDAGHWRFGIYARYPRRHYLYFGRPVFYSSYRGGHSWHSNGGRSYYHGRKSHYIHSGSRNHGGLRDRWDNGTLERRPSNARGSSTKVTVNHGSRPSGNFGNGGRIRNNRHDNNHATQDNNRHDNNKHSSTSGRPSGSNGKRELTTGGSSTNRGSFSTRRSDNRSNSSVRSNSGSSHSSRNSSVSSQRSSSPSRSSATSTRSTSRSSNNGGGRFGGHR